MKTVRLALVFILVCMAALPSKGQEERLEEMRGKTVLVFTPHPDDDLSARVGPSPC